MQTENKVELTTVLEAITTLGKKVDKLSEQIAPTIRKKKLFNQDNRNEKLIEYLKTKDPEYSYSTEELFHGYHAFLGTKPEPNMLIPFGKRLSKLGFGVHQHQIKGVNRRMRTFPVGGL